MKKLKVITIAAVTALGFSSCNNHEAEIQGLNKKADSLQYIVNGRDSSINDFMNSFTEIEMNLDSVSRKQNVISQKVDGQQGEMKTTTKDRINQEIASINQLMDENRKKIAELNRRVKNSNGKITKFEEMIKMLNDQLAQKDTELADLNTKLASLNDQVAQLNISVDTLTNQNKSQAEMIADQTNTIHTAYYIVGKTKELRDEKVINRSGGLLGIGKTSALNPTFNNSYFTKIDYTQTTTIPISSEDAKIITVHPAGSYTLTKSSNKQSQLVISDPDKFWSTSKYLVVVKD